VKKQLQRYTAVSLLLVMLLAALPKVYVHQLMGHVHHAAPATEQMAFTAGDANPDCTFEKFDTPVHYTVFRFVLSFLPLAPMHDVAFTPLTDSLPVQQQAHIPPRGPPATS
jgi:hypothetical protein